MMDAVEFIMKRERMCKPNIAHCKSCPVDIEIRKRGLKTTCYGFQVTYPKTFVEIVEQWNKEHPMKTSQSEFLKMFPGAIIAEDGYPCAEPCFLGIQCTSKARRAENCLDCRKQFWNEEVE